MAIYIIDDERLIERYRNYWVAFCAIGLLSTAGSARALASTEAFKFTMRLLKQQLHLESQ